MRSRAAKLAETKEEYQRETYVKSPFSGIITGQRLREGEIVQAGTTLYDIRPESGNEELMAIVYVSALTGNKEFASWVVQSCGGAIMEVRVALTRDEGTPSGYLWTTVMRAEEIIKSGMTCTATAIVKRQAPLVKAFDKLSHGYGAIEL